MKIACAPDSYSPHEDAMDRKPTLGESKEDPQQAGVSNHYYNGSAVSPGSPPLLATTSESEEAHYSRVQPAPDHASSPSDRSWGNPYIMAMHQPPHVRPQQQHQQQQQYGSPQSFYLAQQQPQQQQPQQQRGMYISNQIMHPSQAPHGYYQSPQSINNWHLGSTPPMLPSNPFMALPQQPYYGHQHLPQQYPQQQQQQHASPHHSPHRPGPLAPMTMYQTLDSRGSLSSYSSNDTPSGCSSRHNNGNNNSRRGRGGRNRRGSNNHHNHRGGSSSNGGSPPNRGWYRYDDSTTLYQMRGRIVEIAKDRDGSKFIQRRLQVSDHNEMQIAYEEALEGIAELWNDVYGNYILQGILDLGTDGMKDGIGRRIVEGDVVSLSTKVYGCRLIQKALDTLTKEDVATIVSSIKGKVSLLVHDHNGNHVIQKSVTKINEFFYQAEALKQATVIHTPKGLSREEREEESDADHAMLVDSLDIIITEVNASMKDMAIHPYGCRVVQRLIEHSVDPHKDRVLDCIVDEGLFGTLINHEYGNYVVQRVLAYGRESDKVAIFDTITSNILKLSKMKHSSNVVEMMLTYGNVEQRHKIVGEILSCYCVDQDFVSKPAAVSMAEDNYANYVVKTSLDVLQDGAQRERLFDLLISHLEDLEKSPFAKQVVLRVKAYAQDIAYE